MTATLPSSTASSLVALARDIKLSHTVFALPFALLAAFLAAGGFPAPTQLVLILLCMVSARTLAMTANRLLDSRLDSQNPRTQKRAIPAGKVGKPLALLVILSCALAFLASCYGFLHFYSNPWPLRLAIPVLALLAAYPLLKRFTLLCHYYLGLALALAPVCAYLAIAGTLAPAPFVLAAAVLLWTAGFDILYACQDYHSDLATGTFSIPARIGISAAFWVARASHLLSALCLLTLPLVSGQLGVLYWIGAGVACALLLVEHIVVSPRDLSRINLAFFTLNGCVALVVGALGILDVLV
jgi:4-hydroxybenzoate polyprenyltransferase